MQHPMPETEPRPVLQSGQAQSPAPSSPLCPETFLDWFTTLSSQVNQGLFQFNFDQNVIFYLKHGLGRSLRLDHVDIEDFFAANHGGNCIHIAMLFNCRLFAALAGYFSDHSIPFEVHTSPVQGPHFSLQLNLGGKNIGVESYLVPFFEDIKGSYAITNMIHFTNFTRIRMDGITRSYLNEAGRLFSRTIPENTLNRESGKAVFFSDLHLETYPQIGKSIGQAILCFLREGKIPQKKVQFFALEPVDIGLLGPWLEQSVSGPYARIPMIVKADSDGALIAFCKFVVSEQNFLVATVMFRDEQGNSVEHTLNTAELEKIVAGRDIFPFGLVAEKVGLTNEVEGNLIERTKCLLEHGHQLLQK
jgi:hypothetical protein